MLPVPPFINALALLLSLLTPPPLTAHRSLVYHPKQQGVDGFGEKQFLAPDRIHPNDRGHQYVAQLVVRFLQRILLRERQAQQAAEAASDDSFASEQQQEQQQQGAAAAQGPPAEPRLRTAWATPGPEQLPPPMLAGAEALEAEACLQNQRFKAAVVPGSMTGFAWEDQGLAGRPEVRAVSHAAGARLTIKLDTGAH